MRIIRVPAFIFISKLFLLVAAFLFTEIRYGTLHTIEATESLTYLYYFILVCALTVFLMDLPLIFLLLGKQTIKQKLLTFLSSLALHIGALVLTLGTLQLSPKL